MIEPLDGAVALTDWGVIEASGADAATFLQGQLTNDVLSLDDAHARLAGFCSAKGRLQASFMVVKRDAETFWLACAADLLTPTLKRLSMFVLRAKCKLTDATAEVALFGVVGRTAEALAPTVAYGSMRTADGGIAVRLPDAAGLARVLVFGAASLRSSPAITLADWRSLETQSGVVTIEAATVDRFVPQMVNFEVVGGVDFKKGCYPGQEVVARSQYRGTTKRRVALFTCDQVPAVGEDVFHSSDAAQPSGLVANSAPCLSGVRSGSASNAAIAANAAGTGGYALVEVKLALLGSGTWHLGAIDGPVLRPETLPYALPTAEAESAA